jgi:CBS domain-containing protein
MALNFSVVENFVAEYREVMNDRTLLRHERYRILAELGDSLQTALKDYESFENELASLIISRVETTTSYGELLECHRRAVVGVENFFLEEDSVVDVHDLFRIIRDRIAIRVLTLAEEEMVGEGFGPPPADYAWVALGSEGRDEQTLLTDQDNMLIYGEEAKEKGGGKGPAGLSGEAIGRYYEAFAKRVTERLHAVGFELCKGGVMPSSRRWRGTVTEFRQRLEERMVYDRGDFELLDLIILTDARLVQGNKGLFDDVITHFYGKLSENRHVMKDFAEAAVLMPTALTFFGNFKTEKEGENEGKFNIKLLGWSPLILSVRMAALGSGIYETNTIKRIQRLRQANIIKKETEEGLLNAYLVFVKFRLMNQINNREEGGGVNLSFVDPTLLGAEGEEALRTGMKAVEAFQKYIQGVLLFGQPL